MQTKTRAHKRAFLHQSQRIGMHQGCRTLGLFSLILFLSTLAFKFDRIARDNVMLLTMFFLPLTKNNCKPRVDVDHLSKNNLVHFLYGSHLAATNLEWMDEFCITIIRCFPSLKQERRFLSHTILCKCVPDDFHCILAPLKEVRLRWHQRKSATVNHWHVCIVVLRGWQ